MARASARAAAPSRPRGLRAERRRAAPAGPRDRALCSWASAPGSSGPAPAAPLAAAGPAAASWAVASRAKRYRHCGRALAPPRGDRDGRRAGGRALRALGARTRRPARSKGPAAAEMSRLRADLDLGLSAGGGPGRVARADPLRSGRLVLLRARSRSGSPEATWSASCAATRRPRRPASGSRPTLARRPRRHASPASSWPRCPRARRSSPSFSIRGSSRASLESTASLALLALPSRFRSQGFAAISRLGRVAEPHEPRARGAGWDPRLRGGVGARRHARVAAASQAARSRHRPARWPARSPRGAPRRRTPARAGRTLGDESPRAGSSGAKLVRASALGAFAPCRRAGCARAAGAGSGAGARRFGLRRPRRLGRADRAPAPKQPMVAALPDALDLVAVGAATGRTPVALFSEIAHGNGRTARGRAGPGGRRDRGRRAAGRRA